MLGVVVITRNEERNIERTLTSLASNLISVIIVSDSNSTDNTALIVSGLAKEDSRIKFFSYTTAPFTAARGRNEGVKVLPAGVEHILFLDGDMELKPRFIEAAIDALTKNSKLAAVSGQMDNYFYNDRQELVEKQFNVYDVEKNQAGGAFLICRSGFDNVSGFNSNLIVNEEAHLEYKLNQNGWIMKRYDIPMIIHHTEMSVSKTRLRERLLDRKLTALGVNVCESFSDIDYFKILLRDNPYTLISSLYILLAPLLFYINPYLSVIALLAIYSTFVFRLRSLRIPVNYLLYGAGVIIGCCGCLYKRKDKVKL